METATTDLGSDALAVLWDLDGTLIDSEPLWHAEQQRFVQAGGGTWTPEDRHAMVGMNMTESSQYLLTKAPRPATTDPAVVSAQIIAGVVAQVGRQVPWRPGARALLAALRSCRVPMALVTSAWPGVIQAMLRQLPPATFAVVVDGQSVTRSKPDPEPYQTAVDHLGYPAAFCLAIEDSVPGIRSAVSAQVPTLAVPHLVPIDPEPGVVIRMSLDGLNVADLCELRNRARMI